MTERNITDIDSFLSDISQYNGEIFVNVSSSTDFNTVKNFIDNYHLIAFLPGEHAIYAQGHKYTSITDDQIQSIINCASSISSITKKIAIVNNSGEQSDDELESIIGTLSYGTGDDAFSESNVTDFVKRVLERIEAGDSSINHELDEINERLDNIDNKLTGINETVKGYVDNEINTLSSSLNNQIATSITDIINDAPQSFDTLKEISDWIAAHPENTAAMNSDINDLKTKTAKLLGTVTEEVLDPETQETIIQIKKFTNSSGSLNGQNWATSIEEINNLFNEVSFASNVQDNAEANKIDEVDFANQNFSELTGSNTDDSLKFGEANLNNKNVGISVNLELIKKIQQYTLSTASNTAQTHAEKALNDAKAYTDEKLTLTII